MTELSQTAQKIHQSKYAHTLKNGKKEAWGQTAVRVAEYVSRAEENESDRLQYLADFAKIILEMSFVPGGRILANAGTEIKNLFNCFVMPIEDSRKSIYTTLANAAEIFAWGGGIGFNFSNIRENGALVRPTGGQASGPVSFMELFDTTGEVISQASRRGAQIGILNVDHQDIFRFISYKSNLNNKNQRIVQDYMKNLETKVSDWDNTVLLDSVQFLIQVLADSQLNHFNVSVGITDDFMEAVVSGNMWQLNSTVGEEPINVSADSIMTEISYSAWKSGDPGIYFIDRANEFNLVPYLGNLESTNPCGEVPLLPYESCCLGSINLTNFVDRKFIDVEYLKSVVKYAVRFLDNVQTLNETPIKEINEATKKTRRLGLGIMGLADLLLELEIPYNHEEAIEVSRFLAKTIQKAGWEASIELAKEKGGFPAFDKEKINWKLLDNLGINHTTLRNVAVTSIAPTGSIALLANVNSGIEPFFARKYIRNITHGIGNTIQDTIKSENRAVVTAHEISWLQHIDMQAAWQEFTDNAVSKTVNMPNNICRNEVTDSFIYAWEKGCKGITIYRNNSKSFQILNPELE